MKNFIIRVSEKGYFFVLVNQEDNNHVLLRSHSEQSVAYFKTKSHCLTVIEKLRRRGVIAGAYDKRRPMGNNWNFYIKDDDEKMTRLAEGTEYDTDLKMDIAIQTLIRCIEQASVVDQTLVFMDIEF